MQNETSGSVVEQRHDLTGCLPIGQHHGGRRIRHVQTCQRPLHAVPPIESWRAFSVTGHKDGVPVRAQNALPHRGERQRDLSRQLRGVPFGGEVHDPQAGGLGRNPSQDERRSSDDDGIARGVRRNGATERRAQVANAEVTRVER